MSSATVPRAGGSRRRTGSHDMARAGFAHRCGRCQRGNLSAVVSIDTGVTTAEAERVPGAGRDEGSGDDDPPASADRVAELRPVASFEAVYRATFDRLHR